MKIKTKRTMASDEALLATEVIILSEISKVNKQFGDFPIMTVGEAISHFGGAYRFHALFIDSNNTRFWDEEDDDSTSVLYMLAIKSKKPVCPKGALSVYDRVHGYASYRHRFPLSFRSSRYRRSRNISILAELKAAEYAAENGVSLRGKRLSNLVYETFDKPRGCNSHRNWKQFRKTQYKGAESK